jgi:hypothetical protein
VFVHAAELLDAKIAVGDLFPFSVFDARRQCLNRRGDRPIVEPDAFGEGRLRRREQAAVERRNLQRAGAAAPMGKPCERLQALPQSARDPARDFTPHVPEGVAVAIDGMPARNQSSRFGEQQEEQAVHHDQRFIEQPGVVARLPAGRNDAERRDQLEDGVRNARTEGKPNHRPVALRVGHYPLERGAVRRAAQTLRSEQPAQHRQPPVGFDGCRQIELQEPARVRTLGVEQAN